MRFVQNPLPSQTSARRLLSRLGIVAGLGAALYSNEAQAQSITVDVSDVKQIIDGFGASTAFFGAEIPEEDAEFLFSPETGLGLSLCRVLIDQEGTTPEIASAIQAHSYGAKVWGSVWSPPAEWKTNGVLAGQPTPAELKTANYTDFANLLADFVEYMESEGVPVFAVSPQNEPDYEATWDAANYTPQQMMVLIRDHIGPVFQERGITATIAAPDTAFLRNLPDYAGAIINDPQAAQYVDVIATHPYSESGFDPNYRDPQNAGMSFWQTEISQENLNGDTPDPSINSAIEMVRLIHEQLTVIEMNAWNWWSFYYPDPIDDPQRQNPALIQEGVRFKRAYAFGNFSKFVRPGYHRIEAQPSDQGDVLTSAYFTDARIVVVAMNGNNSGADRDFQINGALGGPIASAVPWVTSASLSLEQQTPIDIVDGGFSYSLPGRSVTSFVIDVDLPDVDPDTTTTGSVGGSGGATAGVGGGSTTGVVAAGGAGVAGATAAVGAGGATSVGGAVSTVAGVTSTTGAPATVTTTGVGGTQPTTTGGLTTDVTGVTGAQPAGAGTLAEEGSGCGCRTVGSSSSAGWTASLVLLGLGLSRRRRFGAER